MSRKMIDYQVEGNKISTIDGYKVGGGDELTGQKLFDTTTNSVEIDRTVSSDNKLKLTLHKYKVNAKGWNQIHVDISKIVVDNKIPKFSQFSLSLGSAAWGGDAKGILTEYCDLYGIEYRALGVALPSDTKKLYKAILQPYCSIESDSAKWYLRVIPLEDIDVSTITDKTNATFIPSKEYGAGAAQILGYYITYTLYE